MRGKRILGAVVGLVATLPIAAADPATAATTCAEVHTDETISGPVTVPPGALCEIVGSTVSGNVVVGAGGLVRILATTVTGAVTTTGGAIQVLEGSHVRGNVMANAPVEFVEGFVTYFPVVLCESSFNGSVTVRNTPADTFDVIRIGDSAFAGCDGGNTIRGNLTSSNNVLNAGVHVIRNNRVGSSITCLGNTPPPTVSGNTVVGAKVGQCSTP